MSAAPDSRTKWRVGIWLAGELLLGTLSIGKKMVLLIPPGAMPQVCPIYSEAQSLAEECSWCLATRRKSSSTALAGTSHLRAILSSLSKKHFS